VLARTIPGSLLAFLDQFVLAYIQVIRQIYLEHVITDSPFIDVQRIVADENAGQDEFYEGGGLATQIPPEVATPSELFSLTGL